ncbi:MAG TPA: bifunctional enoyl-CoA hydratase/phosphate acetyltransferase [Acetobacteraceae bacterium]|nr:bifunctional enoyl-CoA hydratase/phosphate acetyltransferase [Acetobacteraceae bacterium]
MSLHGVYPLATAVVPPGDDVSLRGAIEAQKLGLITAILVGPPPRIRSAAASAGLDIFGLQVVASEHRHDAAANAMALLREGIADARMKGSLHIDGVRRAVVASDTGIRTARRISDCLVIDVPSQADPLIIADAAMNIAPTLAAKVDIVQNAIDLARAGGVPDIRGAIPSAMETVNPKVPSIIEAAALCKMADRGQITGATLDDPLALDDTIDLAMAVIKHIVSPVAGRADVLVVPGLVAGNILAKSLSFLAGADSAGVVLGARSDHPDQPGGYVGGTAGVVCAGGTGRRATQGVAATKPRLRRVRSPRGPRRRPCPRRTAR